MSAVKEFPKKNEKKRQTSYVTKTLQSKKNVFIKCGSYSPSFLVHLTKISKKHPFKRSFTVHITSLSACHTKIITPFRSTYRAKHWIYINGAS